MRFAKTALMQHPLVASAYMMVEKTAGPGHADVRAAVAASALYARHARPADPAVAAALLFHNHAYPQVRAIGGRVEELASFAIEMAGLAKAVTPKGDARRADIMLAQAAVQARRLEREIKGDGFYIFNTIQARFARLQQLVDDAAAYSQNPALVDAAQTALTKAQITQEKRMGAVRVATAFARTGLPAHPLVEQVYRDVRASALKSSPHSGGHLDFLVPVARLLADTVDHIEPSLLAAVLLNQTFAAKADIAKRYSARVAELYAVTSPMQDTKGSVAGAENIRAAIDAHLLREWVASIKGKPSARHEETLYDIERTAARAVKAVRAGKIAPRLAAVLQRAAEDGTALIRTPAAVAIRKPGSPAPDFNGGW